MITAMSFDLAVLAVDRGVTPDEVRYRFEQCNSMAEHRVGDLDARIVNFYQDLTARFPDHEPYDPETSPWMSTPLDTGIDHVVVNIGSRRGDEAVEAIFELAELHGLAVFDPQSDEVHLPPL
jgi:hypothetical protein